MSEFLQPSPNEQEEKPQQPDQGAAEFTDEDNVQAKNLLKEMMEALMCGDTDKGKDLADQIKGKSIGKKIGYDK